MFADWLMKTVLSKAGSHIPKPVFGRLESALNYLHVGRWMKDHQFSPAYVLRRRRELIATVAKLICDMEVLGTWNSACGRAKASGSGPSP